MGDDKSSAIIMASRDRERDRELLIPVANDEASSKPSSSSSSSSTHHHHHHTGHETFYKVVRSWASKKFMTGCVILFPIAITFYITWWFIHFVDGFFSPIYAQLGIDIFARYLTIGIRAERSVMNGAGETTLRQLQLQLRAKLRDSGSHRAEEKRFRRMTTEELRSLLHRKVLRTDLKTEAYDGSSRAGVVQEGALTEASSEILGDLRAESVDPSALSRSGHRSIKSEASTTESENIDAKWLGLRDSGVNGSYLPRSGVGAHVSDWVESDIRMATANSCGSGRARIIVCRSASNGYKSHQFWAGSRDDDMISAKIKVEFENVSTIGVEFGIMGAGFCDTVTGGFVPQNFNKLGAYPSVNSDVIGDEYAFSGDKTVESAISDNLMAESLISCGNEVRPSNSSKIGPNSNSITNGPQNLSEIWPNSGEIVFGLAMNGAKLLKAGNKLEVGDWREDLHGQQFKSPTSSQQPLLLLVTRPIMHQEPNKMVTKGYDVIESVLFNFQAPITRGLVTVLFKSSGFCAPIEIPKSGLIAMGRSWRYSAAIT